MQIYNAIPKLAPPSIQLLFENTRLDFTKTTLLLYAYAIQSKRKYRKVSEVVFYYSLVNFDLINLFLSDKVNENPVSTNQYYRFQLNINRILLQLSQLAFIEVKGDLTLKTDDIGVRLMPAGVTFVEGLKSDYFTYLINEYTNALNTIECSVTNLKKLRGE